MLYARIIQAAKLFNIFSNHGISGHLLSFHIKLGKQTLCSSVYKNICANFERTQLGGFTQCQGKHWANERLGVSERRYFILYKWPCALFCARISVIKYF